MYAYTTYLYYVHMVKYIVIAMAIHGLLSTCFVFIIINQREGKKELQG